MVHNHPGLIRGCLEEPAPPATVNDDDRVGEVLAIGVNAERGGAPRSRRSWKTMDCEVVPAEPSGASSSTSPFCFPRPSSMLLC